MDSKNKIFTKSDLLKEYKIEELIDKCTFGKVKLGIHKKTNEKVYFKLFQILFIIGCY